MGDDLADYSGYQRWSPSRWGWEFLRRHPAYIEACRKLPKPGNEPSDEKEAKRVERRRCKLAKEFGLKRFKDYRQPHGKSAVRPSFLSVAVTHWSNRDDGPKSRRRVKVSLRKGQVLVRFDVRQALGSSRGLVEQLKRAEQLARTEQEKLLSQLGKTKVGHFNRDRDNFIRHIRVLDLRASNHSWPEVARILLPEQAAAMSRDQIKDRLVPVLKEAESVVRQYLEIAAMAKVPASSRANAPA